MKALVGASRSYGKNFISVHHVGGIYEQRLNKSGYYDDVKVKDTWEGFTKLGALVDVIARSYTEKETIPNKDPRKPPTIKKVGYIIIEHCGLTTDAEGFKITDPTFEKILNTINLYRAASGVTSPSR